MDSVVTDRTDQTAAHIPGPWIAETSVCEDAEERGLAVIAVIPDLERVPGTTPTRGMVAWVHSGLGACQTDEQAVATARLIAAAPELFASLYEIVSEWGYPNTPKWHRARDALDKAEGRKGARPCPHCGHSVSTDQSATLIERLEAEGRAWEEVSGGHPLAGLGYDAAAAIVALRVLLFEAQQRLDMAFCLSDDDRVSRRFAETRDKIQDALKNGN